MRFVSKYQNYSCRIRNHVEMVLATGQRQVMQEGFTADFKHGDVTEWERSEAIKTFKFNGMPTELDEVTPIDPTYRLSCFDTLTVVDPELRKEAETILMNAAGQDFIYVPKPALRKPWPRYDEFDGDGLTLVKKLVEDGISVEHALAYEQDNQNRKEIVAALQEAVKVMPKEEEVVVG